MPVRRRGGLEVTVSFEDLCVGFRVWGLGCRVWGLGFGVWALRLGFGIRYSVLTTGILTPNP